MALAWESLLSECDRRLKSSDIRDLLAVTARPDIISFAGGLPAPELFPVEELRASFDAVLRSDGAGALQYGPTEGHLPLRTYLAGRLARRGITADPDEILLTTGSQQALALLSTVLLRREAPVMVEAPSYVGALQAFAAYEPRYLSVPMDDQGLRVERAARLLAGSRPALLYTISTFQNPSGVTMSLPRRHALLEVGAQHSVPLVEDDPYGELRFDGEAVPPLRALPGGEETLYLGTISKILAPGLRLGWVVAPRPLIRRLVMAKQAADLHTDSLVQRAVLHYCTHVDLDRHIARITAVYRERRDTMLRAMERCFPEGVRWTHPDGGLFAWVTLPEGCDSRALLSAALDQGVAFVPGTAFYTDGGGGNSLRLNFSHAEPARIEEGIRRLGAVLSEQVQRYGSGRVVAGGQTVTAARSEPAGKGMESDG